MYNEQEQLQLCKIIKVFDSYIDCSPYFTVTWDKKLGYLLIIIDTDHEIVAEPKIIRSAEELCYFIFREISKDVMEELSTFNVDPIDATEIEKSAIRRRLEKYAFLLPEYRYLVEAVFGKYVTII